MSEKESMTTTVWPFTEHQIEALRGLFRSENRYKTKIVNKVGMTSEGALIVECMAEGEFKTFSVSRDENRESYFEKYFKPEKG